jgi:hypothetical protein
MGMGEDRLRGWVQRNREIIEKGGLPLPFVPVFNAKDKPEGGAIFSTLDRVESMNVPSVATGLKFSPDKDIKMFLSPDKVNSSIGTAVKNDDLPF